MYLGGLVEATSMQYCTDLPAQKESTLPFLSLRSNCAFGCAFGCDCSISTYHALLLWRNMGVFYAYTRLNRSSVVQSCNKNADDTDYLFATPGVPFTIMYSSFPFRKWLNKVKVLACQDSFKQFAIISIASTPPTITNKVTASFRHSVRWKWWLLYFQRRKTCDAIILFFYSECMQRVIF